MSSQPITGVTPTDLAEAPLTTVWPTLGAHPAGRWVGRLGAISAGVGPLTLELSGADDVEGDQDVIKTAVGHDFGLTDLLAIDAHDLPPLCPHHAADRHSPRTDGRRGQVDQPR